MSKKRILVIDDEIEVLRTTVRLIDGCYPNLFIIEEAENFCTGQTKADSGNYDLVIADVNMPDGMEPLHADVRSTLYRRSFSISSELDGEKVDASLKDGVLTLRIPKREQYQPRKIEVRVE